MKKFLLATSVLCGISGSALAADAIVMEEPAVVVPAAFSWTGGYVGGEIGYLWGDGDFVSGAASGDIAPDGFLGGVYVGYNYQLDNNVVIGADADFVWTGADDRVGSFVGPAQVGIVDAGLDWEGSVRARLGYAVERFLPYVAGGLAFGRLNASLYDTGGAYVDEASDTNVGWTVGVGLEYAFTDNIIGRAEYRYTDFGSFEGTINAIDSDLDFTSNDVRFGLAYKF